KVFFKHFMNGLYIALCILLFMLAFFIATHNFYPIVGASMLPTIQEEGQGCFIDMGSDVEHGDIVAAFAKSHTRVVKRVIAKDGDLVGYYHNPETGYYETALIYKGSNEVTILKEDYIFAKNDNAISHYNLITWNLDSKEFEFRGYEGQAIQFLIVPENHYYILGDNRGNSSDSSWYGTINRSLIVGKVDMVVDLDSFYLAEIISYCLGWREIL
ncbi:MAG: signal peptidase I, partial [Clostridia bacterium]|nr:signal peptidase I [Clostridia bacterium]